MISVLWCPASSHILPMLVLFLGEITNPRQICDNWQLFFVIARKQWFWGLVPLQDTRIQQKQCMCVKKKNNQHFFSFMNGAKTKMLIGSKGEMVCIVYVCIVCSGNLVMQCDSSGPLNRKQRDGEVKSQTAQRNHRAEQSLLCLISSAGALLSLGVLWHQQDTRLRKSYQPLPHTRAQSHMHTHRHWLALGQVPAQRGCALEVSGDKTILGDSFHVRFFKCWCVTLMVFDTSLWPPFISADN